METGERVIVVALGRVMGHVQRVEMSEVGREFDVEVSVTRGLKICGMGGC